MRPFVNPQRAMASQQFSERVFVAIIIAALASVASSVCFDQDTGSSADFEFTCSNKTTEFYVEMIHQIEKLYKINIICHNNDWTKWPDVKLNLSSADAIAEIQFDNCSFPSTVNVQNILNSMKLPVIPKTEFKHLNGMLDRKNLEGLSVTEFHLGYGDFKELPFDLMYDVKNVHLFLISNTKLMDIPDSFFGNWAQNLTRVNLQHNKLRKIKKNDFSRLVNLTSLNLAYNQITEIESAAFEKLVHLQSIDLSFNRLSTLPVGVFQQTIRLKTIDLGRNWFNEIPQHLLANTTRLEKFTLDVNNGTLSTLPDMLFGNLSNLKYVSLQANQLKSVPSNLFTGCFNITSIYLDDNELTTLPSGLFNDTTELVYLRVSNNRLETLPAHIFSKLHRLYQLHLGTNRLTSLMPEVLEGLQSISAPFEFEAPKNNITQIDDQLFHYLKSAFLINLSDNQITFEGRQYEVKLQDMNESSLINTLKNEYLPLVEGELMHKRHLKLNHNNIKEFNGGVLKLLKYVQHVDLSSNHISQINLSGLPVDLLMWNMTLNGKVYSGHKKIELMNNPFYCDCDIKAFIDQLNGRNGTNLLKKVIQSSKYIKCASPPEMKGRLLKTIRPDDLNCPPNTSDPPRVQKIE